jgi:hypothetical protein
MDRNEFIAGQGWTERTSSIMFTEIEKRREERRGEERRGEETRRDETRREERRGEERRGDERRREEKRREEKRREEKRREEKRREEKRREAMYRKGHIYTQSCGTCQGREPFMKGLCRRRKDTLQRVRRELEKGEERDTKK